MTNGVFQPDPAARELIVRRMREVDSPALLIDSFLRQVRVLTAGETGLLDRSMIEPVGDVADSASLGRFGDAGRRAISRTVMIKLNGGLGTSMGLEKAKSLLSVKRGLTFLDIVAGQVKYIRQATGSSFPLVLMNSFSTHEDTLAALTAHPELEAGQQGIPLTFLQHQVPKLRQDNLRPVDWPADRGREWCPPGHGNIYLALVTSGLLETLLKKGFEYAFVANKDNLGATLDTDILGFFAENRIPFLMEVTDRTEADRKGGHLALSRKGGLVLRESAQCPREEEAEFQDIQKYRFFNTNNLWVNLKSLKERLEAHQYDLGLPLIVNRKTVDPRNHRSPPVFQLETAMGAAISVFPGAQAVRVPRSRFVPVKTTNDLLALWSDIFVLGDDMHISMQPSRKGRTVVIHLDPRFYSAYTDLEARFPEGAPSLLECDSLKVEGDIRFGRGVVLRGKVHLKNVGPEPMVIKDGTAISG